MVPASLLVLGVLLADPVAVRYDGHQVLRFEPQTRAQMELILELADEKWSHHVALGPLDVRVSPQSLPAIDAAGLDYEVLNADLQAAADTEADRITAAAPTTGAPSSWFSEFKDYDAINAYLVQLAAQRPEIAEIVSVGSTLEARQIQGVKIGSPASGKTAVIFSGTMHAREWLAPMVTMCIAEHFINGYGTDPQVTELVDTIDIHVVPVINPDGYVRSWTGDRYWRKNTREDYGVDLNRNWGYEWGGAGASTNPYDENYRGSGPFSEPESQALADYIEASPELLAHIDFHAYANLIIYPWGYGYDSPPDEALLNMLASDMSSAMSGAGGQYYQPIQGADFYPAAGAIDDWAYGDQGLMSFTIELRGNDFVVSPSMIAPTCDENIAAALSLSEWVAQSSDPMPEGDDGDAEGDGDSADEAGDDVGGSSGGNGGDGGTGDGDGEDGGNSGSGPLSAGALPEDWGDGEDGGCGCTTDDPPRLAPHIAPHIAWFAVLVLGLGLRRRHGTK